MDSNFSDAVLQCTRPIPRNASRKRNNNAAEASASKRSYTILRKATQSKKKSDMKPTSLLSLPFNIRQIIYEAVFGDDVIHTVRSDSSGNKGFTLPSLLKICKTIYEEALPLFYKSAHFLMEITELQDAMTLGHWLWKIGDAQCDTIRNVRIVITLSSTTLSKASFEERVSAVDYLLLYLSRLLPNLARVEIVFSPLQARFMFFNYPQKVNDWVDLLLRFPEMREIVFREYPLDEEHQGESWSGLVVSVRCELSEYSHKEISKDIEGFLEA